MKDSVTAAAAALARGQLIIVTDDTDRENEADLVLAAQHANPEAIAFMVRHTTGIVCAPMSAERADELELTPMVDLNTDVHATAFTVTVDHVSVSTGVSAADRAATLRALCQPTTAPGDLRRPGHVFPLRARPGGVLARPGHTEASVDLMRLAGLAEVAVISELVADDGSMMTGSALHSFAVRHDLPILRIDDLIRHRRRTERLVERMATSTMPTDLGDFRAVAFRSTVTGDEHLALVMGDVSQASTTGSGVLARVHSECLTGDILGSQRCDCGDQLRRSMTTIAAEGCGVVVYLRGHEGRGIGLAHKIRAYSLQDGGLDTVDANTAQGLPIDARDYEVAARILLELGVSRIRLITNNPAKSRALSDSGLVVLERVVLPTTPTPHNVKYLATKRERMGHHLPMDLDRYA